MESNKTAQLRVQNSAQTTFRLSPCAPCSNDETFQYLSRSLGFTPVPPYKSSNLPALISAVAAADVVCDFNVDATEPTSMSSGAAISSSLVLSCATNEYLKKYQLFLRATLAVQLGNNGIAHFKNANNRTACIRHQCRKTTVLSCHRCLLNTGVEKMNI